MRCKKHPEFNPQDEAQFNRREYLDCSVCNGLHYGARPIGDHQGEYAADKQDIANAKMKIGPMNLEQFGHVRFSLGWDYHHSDGPSWWVDEKNRTIYLDCELKKSRLKEFIDEYGCKVSLREWTEPKMVSTVKRGHNLTMTFGASNTEVSLTLKAGMSIAEVCNELMQFMTELQSIPKDNVLELSIADAKK